jgi:hypothetical protein
LRVATQDPANNYLPVFSRNPSAFFGGTAFEPAPERIGDGVAR